MQLARSLLALIACLTCAGAQAQAIYRCGNEYTRVPGSEGKVIETENSATAAQRAEARQVAARERRLAETMVRDRRLQEAALRPTRPVNVGPAPAAPASSTAGNLKPKSKARGKIRVGAAADFSASVPPKAKPKP